MKRLALVLLAGALVVGMLFFGPWRDAWDQSADNLPESAVNTGPGAERLVGQGLRGEETDQQGASTGEAPDRKVLAAGTIRVAGRLLDNKGAPVIETTVDLHLGDGQDRRNRFPFPTTREAKKPDQQTRSDAAGRFCFKVQIEKGGQLALPEGDLVWERRPPRFLASREDLDMGDLVVFRGAVMRGRVLTASDQPIQNAKLRFMGYEGHGYIPRAAESDPRGGFELRGLPRGDGYLTVTCAGHVGIYKRITIAAGDTVDGVIVRLRRGVELVGLVVDDQWNPVAGASVRVWGPGRSTEEGLEYTSGSAETDAKGVFRVAGLGTGPYQVSVKAKGHVSKSVKDIQIEAGEVRLELPRLGSLAGHVLDERGQPIAGSTVYWTKQAPNFKPGVLGTVDASLMPGGVRFTRSMVPGRGQLGNAAKTDEGGRFVLEGIQPGQVWLVAGGAHPRAVQGPLEIVAGKRLEGVEIAARRGGVAMVQVLDPDGNPIENAQVRLSLPDRRPANRFPSGAPFFQGLPGNMVQQPAVALDVTDKNGECEFAGVESGEYQLHATHTSWVSPKPIRLVVPARGRVDTRIEMQAGGTVAVRVLDDEGRPAAEQGFRILQAGQRKKSGRTDATGRATVGPLATGDYEAVLQNTMDSGQGGPMFWGFYMNQSSGAEIGARVSFHVDANKTVEVLLERPKLASLSGTVRDSTGLRKNTRVSLMAKPAPDQHDAAAMNTLQRTRTDDNGVFRFDGLQPGTYVLAIQRDRKAMLYRQEVTIRGTGAHVHDPYLAAGSVQVEVRSGGKPVGGVNVDLRVDGASSLYPLYWQGGAQQVAAVSDARGIASFQDVPPGQYSMGVRSEDYAKGKAEPLQVTAGEVTKRELEVEPAATLSVECVPSGGVTKPGPIQLELTRIGEDSKPIRRWLHGTSMKIGQLSSGRYQVRARRMGQPGGAPPWSQLQPVDLQVGKANHLRIVLP